LWRQKSWKDGVSGWGFMTTSHSNTTNVKRGKKGLVWRVGAEVETKGVNTQSDSGTGNYPRMEKFQTEQGSHHRKRRKCVTTKGK